MVGKIKMSNVMPNQQHCVAKALYDNIAESPDELAFRKGDILSVLEQNTGGIEGWWLCSLRGRQGICPGNRLRILAGVFEVRDNEIQNFGKRRSWHVQPNMVLTPQKFGDIYLYDLPSGSQLHQSSVDDATTPTQTYDIPRAISREHSESVLSTASKREDQLSYDTPRAINSSTLSPSSSASSLTAPESLSLPSSNRSSLLSGPDYDVPKPSRPISCQVYDVPAGTPKPKELPLEQAAALDSLNTLQAETGNAITHLLGLVTPSWRTRNNLLLGGQLEIKVAALRLRTVLHDFSDFCSGALGNAHSAQNSTLAAKMAPLIHHLTEADWAVHGACAALDECDWSVDMLVRETDQSDSSPTEGQDWLERIVTIARPLTEDVRRAASFIQGNAPLLFRKDSSDKVGGPKSRAVDNEEEKLPSMHFTGVVDEASSSSTVDLDDARLLKFYAALALNHISHLTEAIDAFLRTVEHNRPPNVFLAHGKLVVLSAHRLVHVGDTVARNVQRTALKQRVQEQADGLSHALDLTVQRTKRAAQHFPSVSAVQDMVDAVVDVSHYASDLRRSLLVATP